MQVIIDAGHFYAMGDLETKRFAPIIKYMKDWTIEEIRAYCTKKGWKLTEIGDKPYQYEYDYNSC